MKTRATSCTSSAARNCRPPPATRRSWGRGRAMPSTVWETDRRLHVPPPRVEILDGYLFATISHGDERKWIGGRYTVDETKNPKWIDVDLGGPFGEGKATKLYGSYEVVDGQLKLALGTTGKRLTRPLELNDGSEVLLLRREGEQRPAPAPSGSSTNRAPARSSTAPVRPPPRARRRRTQSWSPCNRPGTTQQPKSLPGGPLSKPAPAASPTKQLLPDSVPAKAQARAGDAPQVAVIPLRVAGASDRSSGPHFPELASRARSPNSFSDNDLENPTTEIASAHPHAKIPVQFNCVQ